MYGMRGIGPKAIERLRMCAEKPVPHLCKGRGYCPYTRLIKYGLVTHIGNGYYSATKKGKEYIIYPC